MKGPKAIVLGFSLLLIGLSSAAQTRTLKGQAMCPPAFTHCTDQFRCADEGGCARCLRLQQPIPSGWRVVAVRFYSAPPGGETLEGPNQLNEDVQWGKFTRVLMNPGQVEVTFMNWSDRYARKVGMEVDIVPGA